MIVSLLKKPKRINLREQIQKPSKIGTTIYNLTLSLSLINYGIIECANLFLQKNLMRRKKHELISFKGINNKIFLALYNRLGYKVDFQLNGFVFNKKSNLAFFQHQSIVEDGIFLSHIPNLKMVYSEVLDQILFVGKPLSSLLERTGMIPCADAELRKVKDTYSERLKILKENSSRKYNKLRYKLHLGWYKYHCLLSDQDNQKDKIVNRIVNGMEENLSHGKSAGIFPEGQRNENLLRLLLKDENKDTVIKLINSVKNFDKFLMGRTSSDNENKLDEIPLELVLNDKLLRKNKCMPSGTGAILEKFFSNDWTMFLGQDRKIPIFFINVGNVYSTRNIIFDTPKFISDSLLIECGAVIKNDTIDIISSGFSSFLTIDKLKEYINLESESIKNEEVNLLSKKLELEIQKNTEIFEYDRVLYKLERIRMKKENNEYENSLKRRVGYLNTLLRNLSSCNNIRQIIIAGEYTNVQKAEYVITIIDMLLRLYNVYDLQKIISKC